MKRAPEGRYSREFRQEAVKLVLEEKSVIARGRASVVLTAIDVGVLGEAM